MVELNKHNNPIYDIAGSNTAEILRQEQQKHYSNAYLEQHIHPLSKTERQMIENAVRLCNGNIPKAAVYLEVAPSTIYRKIKEWAKKDLQNP